MKRILALVAALTLALAVPIGAQQNRAYDAPAVAVTDSEFAIALGLIEGFADINKYGRTTNADSGVATDVWDGANTTDDVDIWVAPTAARVHAIVSTSDSDGKTGAPSSVGARTIRVYGLTSWSTAETYEDVTLDGTTVVNTANSYVIIHRMKVQTTGASGPNVGTIKATALTDATVTAQIQPLAGQTQMVVYGVPSTQTLFVDSFYLSVNRAVASVACDVTFFRTTDVTNQPNVWTVARTIGLNTTGTSAYQRPTERKIKIVGPAIIKIQVTTTANDTDVSAGFGGTIVTN
jgi:hypothetical protein